MIDHPAVAALHAETPLRVGSLVVTAFGDIVMREGTDAAPQPLWSGPLTDLMALVGVGAGPLRTSLSRLAAAGTLLRGREGRNTFYWIADDSRRAFAQAARTIYGYDTISPTGFCHLALLDRVDRRSRARESLSNAGWRFLGPSTALLPEHLGTAPPPLPDGAIQGKAPFAGALAEVAADVFGLASLDAGYRRFLECFASLATEPPANPAKAVALRLLLVHQFRRLALKDPLLPSQALPSDWRGGAARIAFDAARAGLHAPSETWLAANGFRRAKAP
jgi:phenylacetic acid degradation operon negative regulatory protein